MEQLQLNFTLAFAVALVPIVVGMAWYSQMMFGNAWMQASGMTMDGDTSGMWKLMLVSYVFSVLISVGMYPVVIHQMGLGSMVDNMMKNPATATETTAFMKDAVAKYGHEFRTFKHGALHGALTTIFVAVPIIGMSALYERRGFKYIAIHAGYWLVSLVLMGGIICAYA